ncbi:transcription antitermination factor NusB [uncultured Dubosiella sp.]|uniref:transcription antitermination factor NusB n=1 Tax=uncultured Dubosiella sp. TaxID=1937011 RepID=UPI00258C8BAF|nr:transcription antitermination factor NusB [uncultured Dubosiella sp.]
MSENQPKQLTRHDMREIALRCVYQHLLLGTDIRKCVFDAMRGNNIDGYLYALTIGTIEHEQEYIDIISKYLRKDWSFDRLSVLEQAILLVSLQEILQNDIPKPVVINEAIKLAKKYCDDDSYKLINGVLDQL